MEIRADIAPEVGKVISDQRRVEQILINIVNNAVKFTHEGEVTVTCEKDPKWVTVTVKDTGIGITHEDTHKLFNAFQQIETGLTRRYEGTGLGLSICKKLVELLGGQITAHSDGMGLGAIFRVRIPGGV